MKISASILSCNFLKLKDEIEKLENIKVDFIHLDVMDGHFVPNISFGADIVNLVKSCSSIPIEIHLMISHPINFVDRFSCSDTIIFHLESESDERKTIEKIKSKNIKVGISIKPRTKFEELIPYLHLVDLVLIMTVEPGFGGQSFLENQIEKIKEINRLKNEKDLNFLIEVDGGINNRTSKLCKDAGTEICVVGSYLFKSKNIEKAFESLM